MPLSGASPARGAGALKGGCYVVGLVFTHTTTTGAVSMTYGQEGFTVGTFTSGKATLSFPKHFKFLAGTGGIANTDNDSAASRHRLEVFGVDLSAGTATVRFTGSDDGATEDPGTETCYLTLVVGE